MRARLKLSVLGALSLLVACTSATRRSAFEDDAPAADLVSATEPPPAIGGSYEPSLVTVSLAGTVYAPNASLPMGNALVYLASSEPAALPKGASCDTCKTLASGSFAVSAADGTFAITTRMSVGDAWLVVQKGQFRRVRKIAIEPGGGVLDVGRQKLTLPGRSNRAKGDDVPRMVIVKDDSDFDKIDESLKKLGVTDFEVTYDRSLLEDEAALMAHHIVFIPCGSFRDPHALSPNSQKNLRAFVDAGGKLYVTDWSYEFVRQTFPGYITWDQETDAIGSATDVGPWDAPAKATDEGLDGWLAATGDASFEVEGNWTRIASVHTVEGLDRDERPSEIAPKVWVTAEHDGVSWPATVSFGSGCGRVLFSTYHTEGGFGGSTRLLAQEKALLYTLLEVGVCAGGAGAVN